MPGSEFEALMLGAFEPEIRQGDTAMLLDRHVTCSLLTSEI